MRTKFNIYFFLLDNGFYGSYNNITVILICDMVRFIYGRNRSTRKKGEKHIQQQVINTLYHKELYRVDLEQSGIKLAIEAI